MAQIKISALDTGSPQGTDEIPAVDTTDTTQAASGSTKKYIRSDVLNFYLTALGLTTYSATRVATTLALTVVYDNGALGVGATITNAGAQAALSIDGVTLAISDRVLVKNQASDFENGIYTVTDLGSASTNWVMTRATDYDLASEIVQYGVVLSDQGTTNAGLLWQETGAGPWTMGTTAIIFAAYIVGSGSSVNGGTANQVAYYASTGNVVSGVGPGSAGQLFQSAGSGSAPGYTTATYPSTNTLLGSVIIGDGTNYSQSAFAMETSWAVNEMIYCGTTNNLNSLASVNNAALSTNASGVPTWLALTDGQVVVGSSSGAPLAATITAGTGVSITNAANSITVAATGGGMAWSTDATATIAAAVDNGYVCGAAGATTITLPSTAAVGSVVGVEGLGAGGWILTAAAGDTIQIGAGVTSSGGTLTSAAATDNVYVTCIVADTTWRVSTTNSAGLTIA